MIVMKVAITCDLALSDPLENYGICLGDEHSVDVCSDTQSNHLIVSAKMCTVVILHNHPSLQTFSLDDIRFLRQTEESPFWSWSVIRGKSIIYTKIKNILRGKQYNCLTSVWKAWIVHPWSASDIIGHWLFWQGVVRQDCFIVKEGLLYEQKLCVK